VVEDDAVAQQSIVELIGHDDVQTTTVGTGAEALEEPAERFAADLAEALADGSPLTGEERSARAGLANRQVTLRS
jgi:CheY-like chemotaxis protein